MPNSIRNKQRSNQSGTKTVVVNNILFLLALVMFSSLHTGLFNPLIVCSVDEDKELIIIISGDDGLQKFNLVENISFSPSYQQTLQPLLSKAHEKKR